jgi:hypothetical protein
MVMSSTVNHIPRHPTASAAPRNDPTNAGAVGLAHDIASESDGNLWHELHLLHTWPRPWPFMVARRRALLLDELRRRSGEAA